jgi:hypothetical protein
LPSYVCIPLNESLDAFKSFRCPNGSYCSRTQIHKTELSREARTSYVMKLWTTIIHPVRELSVGLLSTGKN